MKGIILAAGRGSRLGRRTEDRPKCLVEIEGAPMLQWQMAALRSAGIEDVTVIGGYRIDSLEGGEYDLVENVRWAETNMVTSLTCAAEIMRTGEVIVSYSDIVYHPAVVEALAACDAELAITYDERWLELWSERFDDPREDAEQFRVDDNRVIEIGGRPEVLADVEGQYMGLLKFAPEGWKRVERLLVGLDRAEQDRMDMTTLLSRLIASGAEVRGVPVQGRWCEVDSDEDLYRYRSALDRAEAVGGTWHHDWRI